MLRRLTPMILVLAGVNVLQQNLNPHWWWNWGY